MNKLNLSKPNMSIGAILLLVLFVLTSCNQKYIDDDLKVIIRVKDRRAWNKEAKVILINRSDDDLVFYNINTLNDSVYIHEPVGEIPKHKRVKIKISNFKKMPQIKLFRNQKTTVALQLFIVSRARNINLQQKLYLKFIHPSILLKYSHGLLCCLCIIYWLVYFRFLPKNVNRNRLHKKKK